MHKLHCRETQCGIRVTLPTAAEATLQVAAPRPQQECSGRSEPATQCKSRFALPPVLASWAMGEGNATLTVPDSPSPEPPMAAPPSACVPKSRPCIPASDVGAPEASSSQLALTLPAQSSDEMVAPPPLPPFTCVHPPARLQT
eukprot:4232901-Alexandrium_andersonii.AAC.1